MSRPRANSLPGWQFQTLLWSALALAASGLLWLFVLWRRAPGDLPGALDPWLARWHGLSAMAGLFAFGMISAQHIGRGWRMEERRPSGLGIWLLFALVALSGYALAYLVPESWHAPLGYAHSGLGVLAFGLGVLHRR